MKATKLLFLIAIISTQWANAQYTDVINSSRPGVSQTAWAVGKNVAQVEAGFYSVSEKHSLAKKDQNGFGLELTGRYGLFFEELELSVDARFQNSAVNNTVTNTSNSLSGFKNLTVGAKYLVYDPFKNKEEEKPNVYSYFANKKFKWKSMIPAVSVYVGANFDQNNAALLAPYISSALPISDGFNFKGMIAAQHNFDSGWVVVNNFIMDRISTDYTEFQHIITLTKAINQNWVGFGEIHNYSGTYYSDTIARVGGAYLRGTNFQLDGAIAFNIKDTPSVFNVLFGVSYRLDKHTDPDGKDNGTGAKDEFERRENKKRGKKKRKKDKPVGTTGGNKGSRNRSNDFD